MLEPLLLALWCLLESARGAVYAQVKRRGSGHRYWGEVRMGEHAFIYFSENSFVGLFFDFVSAVAWVVLAMYSSWCLKVVLQLLSHPFYHRKVGKLLDFCRFVVGSCERFVIDTFFYVGRRTHQAGYWSLQCFGCRKAGHWFPNQWNYHCLLCL